MKLLRLSPLLLALSLVSATQLSCSVNDYCLNCEKGDGGHHGDGGDDGDGGIKDANVDAGCVPTGGPEQCNGKDDDCNGLVDDNVEHEGEPCDNLNGACAGGVKVCKQGAMTCTKVPTPEICDGIDNNCSGPLPGNPSGADEGDPGPPPAMGMPEMGAQCGNGMDDDGDGVKDDGCPGTGGKCGTDQGECTAGQFHCDPTTGTVKCFGFIDHTGDPELCDGKDNNCNGLFDEGITFNPSTCGPATNTGECKFGTKACMAGQVVCQGAVFPAFDVCNNKDDDCDGVIDQNTNKNTDTSNCGYCGDVCATRANANTTCTVQAHPAVGPAETLAQCGNGMDDDGDGVADDGCSQGTCGYTCKAGYKDLNGMPGDGCEFGPCFPTGIDAAHPNGTEVCDGEDNDCDGLVDAADPDLASQVPSGLCLGKGECGNLHGQPGMAGYDTTSTPPAPTCSGAAGWTCVYAGTTQFPETRCDGLDNNCDGNIDEYQATLGQPIGVTCHEDRENPATQCANNTDDDGDGKVNDGCDAVGPAETGAQCANNTDDDGDGAVNDGCPAIAQLGVCQGTGSYQCDTRSEATRNGASFCSISTAGSAPSAEACDNVDNDCDGVIDNGGSSGNLTVGQEWITLGNGHQMMRYEASRPDATASNSGAVNTLVCSKSGAQPWTNVKYEDALAACNSIGAQLCTESQWHHACSVAVPASGPPNYPVAFSGTATYIEAEDYSSIGVGAAGAESGANCNNATDDDGDGVVNDGCPIVGTGPETMCNDNADNDGDGTVNDGCPTFGPAVEATCNDALDNDLDGVINDGCPASGAAEVNCRDGIDDDGDGLVNDGCPAVGPTWIPNYTAGYSGVSAMEAVPNIGVVLTAAQAVTAGARLDYAVNFTTGTYHVWVKMYANPPHDENGDGINDNDHQIWVGVKDGSGATIVPPQTPTKSIDTGATTGSWKWVDANTFAITTAGVHYVSIYMGEDGVIVDRIFLVSGGANPATGETLTTKGNTWAYASTPNTYQPNTCNGHDYRQVSLSAIARAATGLVTVTTSTNHPFVVGDLVQILGTANTSFEGTYTVKGVLSTTQFTYQQNSTVVQNSTGGTATEAADPILTTGSLASCNAAIGTGIFDMSGNAREWTLAHSTGENPIRGGASNGTAQGISCGLTFTLADDTFFFPNIGFRCCR